MAKKTGLSISEDIFDGDFLDRVFKDRELASIPIKDVVVRRQPRKIFSEKDIEDLASSIGKLGLLQPIVVTPADKGKYILIAGERRLRACKKLGWTTIIARIIRDLEEDNILAIQLAENIQRKDLRVSEKALAVRDYLSRFSQGEDVYKLLLNLISKRKGVPEAFVSSVEALSELIGKSPRTIARWLSVLRFPNWFIEKLEDPSSNLTLKHVEVLLPLAKKEKLLKEVVNKLERNKLSSSELKKEVLRVIDKSETDEALLKSIEADIENLSKKLAKISLDRHKTRIKRKLKKLVNTLG